MKTYILPLIGTIAALVLGTASCTRTLDIDYDEIEPLLVVEGRVSNDGMLVYVRQHSNMADTMNKQGEPDALVTITGSDGFEETLEYGDGRYFSPTNAKGVPGVTYTLHVKKGDKECYAESTMPEPVAIDSISWEWMPIMDGIDIRVAKVFLTDDPDSDQYYFIELMRDGQMIKNAVSSDGGLTERFNYFVWGMTSKNIQEENEKELKKTGKKKSDALYGGDHLTINLRSVGWDAFRYFATLEENSKGINPETNLQGEGCVGYFSAFGVSSVDVVFPKTSE